MAAGTNPWYNPYSSYGSNFGMDFPTTPVGQQYLTENPQAAYTRHIAPFGGGYDPYSQFVQQQYSKVLQGFNAALATNPNLRFNEFLGQFGPQSFRQQFNQLDPTQRGERWGQIVPRARWMMRG